MSVTIELGPGTSSPLTITQDDIVSISPVKIAGGLATFSARIRGNREVEVYAQRQDRLNVKSDGETAWTGYLTTVEHNRRGGETTLRARGIAKRLQETRPDYDTLGGSLTYESIALQDAIEDYWSRTPFTATVTDQSANQIADDELVQEGDTTSEWDSIVSPPADKPLVVQNGSLALAQTCWVFEGESSVITTTRDKTSYSGGSSTGIETSVSTTGDSGSYSLTPAYDVPASALSFNFRVDKIDGDGDGIMDSPEIEIRFNGDTIFGPNKVNTNLLGLEWDDISTDYTGEDLTAGNSYQLEIEVTDASKGTADDELRFDVVAVYDNRYSYNFDNTVDEDNGYLDGPELYPAEVDALLSTVNTSFNITESDVTTTFDDVSNNQALAASNDGGSTFKTATNTNTFNAVFDSVGRELQVRLTLSRYGTRSTATPKTGFDGQTVDSYQATVDGNEITVIDELELSKNHFDNLQTLHEYGDFTWTIEHDDADISDLTVRSFERGDVTASLPVQANAEINKRPKITSERYYNTIFLQGALVSGTRPSAEVKDDAAINDDGREISPGVLRDLDVVTDAGAEFRARALLNKAQKNKALRGEIVTPAVDIHPGYSYAVDFGDGETELPAEEVSVSISNGTAETTINFVRPDGIAGDIEELRRNSRKTQDRI